MAQEAMEKARGEGYIVTEKKRQAGQFLSYEVETPKKLQNF